MKKADNRRCGGLKQPNSGADPKKTHSRGGAARIIRETEVRENGAERNIDFKERAVGETKKNDVLTCRINRTGINGEGISALPDGRTLFVPYACAGEVARVRVEAVKKNLAYGKVAEILEPAITRVVPECPAFTKCGGCQIQHMTYAAQTSWKRDLIEETLLKVGGIRIGVATTVTDGCAYGYRNKIQIPVGVDRNGNTVIGFYRANSHEIVPIDACPLHGEWAAQLIRCVRQFMERERLAGYDEFTRTGDVRHIVARCLGDRVHVCVVTPHDKLPKAEILSAMLGLTFPEFSLVYNVNREDTNVILGKKTVCVAGEERLRSEWQGIRFSLAAPSFLQVNTETAGLLYDGVVRAARVTGEDVVIDAYSGAGILSARLARAAKRVYGIEICKEASADADALKRENAIDNLTNINGDCAERLPRLVGELRDREPSVRLVLVLDPPRKGCDARVLAAALSARPTEIVYISCNPATLARDLAVLVGETYELVSVTPYDLFPQTSHVESLALMTLRGGKRK